VSPPFGAAYLCESECGNAVVDPGEECDPPGAQCTAACKNVRPCTEAGGVSSPTSGRCYFETATAVDWTTATQACPVGTILAAPDDPNETAAALVAAGVTGWMAMEAPTTAGVFQFHGVTRDFNPRRYHGFLAPDPDVATPPACVSITKGDARGDSWRDRTCTTLYPALCERD
jgi:hypothetical protein